LTKSRAGGKQIKRSNRNVLSDQALGGTPFVFLELRMMRVFLDIETLPPDEAVRERITNEVVRELKDRINDDESGNLAALADKRFREQALYGEYGRVLAIGLIVERDGEVKHQGLLGRDRDTMQFHLDEARTLRSFWNLLRAFDARRDLIIGHNLFDFDLPFLCKRSIINRVRPSTELCFARYRSQPIYDTMRQWDRWGRNCVGLSRLAEVLSLESSKQNGIDGSNVYDYYLAGRHDEIADYCLRDVQLVRAIYYRMNFLDSD
jgi:hypothetical protein